MFYISVNDLQQEESMSGIYHVYGRFHDRHTVDILPDISHMETIKEVLLPFQNISLVYASHFPATVEVVNLNHNVIQSVPNIKQMTSLKKLSLCDNKITVLLGLSTALQSLHLEGNPIRTLDKACFPTEEVYDLLSKALTWDQKLALEQPPSHIFQRGYYAVRQYYDQADISTLTGNYKNR